jgi:hypothetical protein
VSWIIDKTLLVPLSLALVLSWWVLTLNLDHFQMAGNLLWNLLDIISTCVPTISKTIWNRMLWSLWSSLVGTKWLVDMQDDRESNHSAKEGGEGLCLGLNTYPNMSPPQHMQILWFLFIQHKCIEWMVDIYTRKACARMCEWHKGESEWISLIFPQGSNN